MKFVIVLLFAIVLAANAKVISLADLLKAYEERNEIGDNTPVANQALYIPMSLKACTSSSCTSACQALGYSHGICVSITTCYCYN